MWVHRTREPVWIQNGLVVVVQKRHYWKICVNYDATVAELEIYMNENDGLLYWRGWLQFESKAVCVQMHVELLLMRLLWKSCWEEPCGGEKEVLGVADLIFFYLYGQEHVFLQLYLLLWVTWMFKMCLNNVRWSEASGIDRSLFKLLPIWRRWDWDDRPKSNPYKIGNLI